MNAQWPNYYEIDMKIKYMLKIKKVETVDEYLKRGGKITVITEEESLNYIHEDTVNPIVPFFGKRFKEVYGKPYIGKGSTPIRGLETGVKRQRKKNRVVKC